ncbi:uncharacterized protein SCHCODRAFT_02743998 [Schizophyllum commune H4-8]|uniref:uncharacterized protein n=1 Tax=Schizophyllum commune (strain H4-8 / FGSC 9210) TaxID=578458 RepID=UPI00215F30B0|nr:uncharacterized protein SCHCODRAFT_02743998 [Schizophyllum commune H4-8]KAI5897640.1 hypothetical protein SCHCODRAFT_02743998 [Schizophyllum commune H4-8]
MRTPTHETSVEDFWQTYVGPLGYQRVSSRDMRDILKRLRSEGHIKCGKWSSLKPQEGLMADSAYKTSLVKVVNAVLKAAATCPSGRFSTDKRTTLFESRSQYEELREVPGAGTHDPESFHVDALHHLRESTYVPGARSGNACCNRIQSRRHKRLINTADVVSSWQIKAKCGSTYLDPSYKTCAAAGQYLYADIRRKFHFAITIEGTQARLWCHSRSLSVVTEMFDIHTSKEELIQWILFVSFATEHQLGFDQTVARVADKTKRWQYQFDIPQSDNTVRTYQTIDTLYESCTASLGHGALRVYKVKRVTEKGKADTFSREDKQVYVLRDCWLLDDEGINLETEDQQALKRALQACTQSKEELDEVSRHFMQIEAEGVVEREELKLLGRKHRRTLFRHVCVDLYKIRDPAVFFFALDKAVFVLDWFRRIGWMHRDISPGNIMVRRLSETSTGPLCERYMAHLADLEWCREYSKISPQEFVAGTMRYMAFEALNDRHMFTQGSKKIKLADTYFVQNPLHDLESTLWMALEFAMCYVPRRLLSTKFCEDPSSTLVSLERRCNDLFPHSTPATWERTMFLLKAPSWKEVESLLRKIHGDDSPLTRLPSLLIDLTGVHEAVEKRIDYDGYQFDDDGAQKRMPKELFDEHAKIYDDVRAVFQTISRYYADVEGQDAFVPLGRVDLCTGKIFAEPDITPSEGSACEAMNVDEEEQDEDRDEQDNHQPRTTKRKAPDEEAALPRRPKRLRTRAPPDTPLQTHKRTKVHQAESGRQALRRSARLVARNNR